MVDYEVLYLKYLVDKGIHWRYGDNVPQEVIDRINMEYDVIIPNKFDSYILTIWISTTSARHLTVYMSSARGMV